MVCERLRVLSELDSADEVDEALRAFWRGSAREIDRLAGASGDERSGLGELLLLLMECASTARPATTRGSK